MTIGETTMKIYKWVPISTNEQKKKHAAKRENKENTLTPKKMHDSSNSNFGMAEDSNTCKWCIKKIKIFVAFYYFIIKSSQCNMKKVQVYLWG